MGRSRNCITSETFQDKMKEKMRLQGVVLDGDAVPEHVLVLHNVQVEMDHFPVDDGDADSVVSFVCRRLPRGKSVNGLSCSLEPVGNKCQFRVTFLLWEPK